MNKYIITFGSGQLLGFQVNPLKVALIIEADNENSARQKVFNFYGIGSKFCTSYPYSKIEEFKTKFNMREYTLDDLEDSRLVICEKCNSISVASDSLGGCSCCGNQDWDYILAYEREY